MPLNVSRFCTLLFLLPAGFVLTTEAQTVPPATQPSPTQQTTTAKPPVTQSSPSVAQPSPAPVIKAPTAGEVMRERISKAKAYIAVRNYNAAIYELEGIRRETSDSAVQAVTNVLLMNSYLEQGDYKRAQDFLNQAYAAVKANKPNAAAAYFAIAGQVVNGARTRVERYRALGLNVGDRTLPLEAINDLEKMRETVEQVVTQSKEVAQDKKNSADAMALLEEASNSRSLIARDDYDAHRWQNEVGDTREQMANSRSQVLNAVNEGVPTTGQPVALASPTPVNGGTITDAALRQPVYTPSTSTQPAATAPVYQKQPDNSQVAANQKPLVQPTVSQSPVNQPPVNDAQRNRVAPNQPVAENPAAKVTVPPAAPGGAAASNATSKDAAQNIVPAIVPPKGGTQNAGTQSGGPSVADKPKDNSPVEVGSLLGYATKQSQPVYPAAARTLRQSGMVKVEVTVDENGQVAEIQKASGPVTLQDAAKDAIKKWRFKPFVRDGQPVKAVGFVTFNFSM